MQELAIKDDTANAFYRYDSSLLFAAKVWFQSFNNISKLFVQFLEHFLRCKYLRKFNEAICTNHNKMNYFKTFEEIPIG